MSSSPIHPGDRRWQDLIEQGKLDEACETVIAKLRFETRDHFVEFFRDETAQTPDDDPAIRHKALTQLAFWTAAAGQDDETEKLLKQAEALETRLEDRRPIVQRQEIAARLRMRRGDLAGSLKLFAEARPWADKLLEPEQRLGFSGYFLCKPAPNRSSPAATGSPTAPPRG